MKRAERAGDRLVGGRNLSLYRGFFLMSSLTAKPPFFLAFQLMIKEKFLSQKVDESR